MNANESREKLLDKIADIYAKQKQSKLTHMQYRKELADAIERASTAGITYREIGDVIGIGKTGISNLVTRGK